jgi:ABC-type bacteriocin/lantibiotic exporter with double-glycine peptidase domain
MSARFARVVLAVPFVPQQRNGECLVACAMMSLLFLGRQPDYLRIARQLDLTSIGTPFPNIRRLAGNGIHVLFGNGTLQILHQHLSRGQSCIVSVQAGQLPHWTGEEFAHAVLLVGMDADYVYMHDPAVMVHPLRVNIGDFDLAWLERDEEYAVLHV